MTPKETPSNCGRQQDQARHTKDANHDEYNGDIWTVIECFDASQAWLKFALVHTEDGLRPCSHQCSFLSHHEIVALAIIVRLGHDDFSRMFGP